jgi:CDP-diacylglycerol--serine O-phosphatidyltransferase
VFALTTEAERWIGLVFTLYAGLTMVTNVPFYSFKTINMKRSIPFVVLLACVLGLALLSLHPPLVLFIGFVAYGVSGYLYFGWRMLRKGRAAH